MPRKSAALPAASAAQAASSASEPLHNTVRLMLEVAERLFAELGVEGVTLNRIVEESGQRNRSALHYHFGSRADIVTRLLHMRFSQVDVLRNRALDELEAKGGANDLEAVLMAAIEPLAQVVRHEDWGARFLKVHAQTLLSPGLRTPDLIAPSVVSGYHRATQMIGGILPEVPRGVMGARMLVVRDHVVFGLVPVVREFGAAGITLEVLSNLVAYCARTLRAAPEPARPRARPAQAR